MPHSPNTRLAGPNPLRFFPQTGTTCPVHQIQRKRSRLALQGFARVFRTCKQAGNPSRPVCTCKKNSRSLRSRFVRTFVKRPAFRPPQRRRRKKRMFCKTCFCKQAWPSSFQPRRAGSGQRPVHCGVCGTQPHQETGSQRIRVHGTTTNGYAPRHSGRLSVP